MKSKAPSKIELAKSSLFFPALVRFGPYYGYRPPAISERLIPHNRLASYSNSRLYSLSLALQRFLYGERPSVVLLIQIRSALSATGIPYPVITI